MYRVKVMLRVKEGEGRECLELDPKRRQVALLDPSRVAVGSNHSFVPACAPKMFAFDALFHPQESQVTPNVIKSHHGSVGKTETMVGRDGNPGIIPMAIAWLFKSIGEQRQKSGARFSVRISAVEVLGAQETLRDLLAPYAHDSEQSPGVYLRDDPLFGAQLQNVSELRASNAQKAAYYLDAALAARTPQGSAGNVHLLFTLHLYQYSLVDGKSGKSAVSGGRSRLHLFDLGGGDKTSKGGLTSSAIGNVLIAIFNGIRHLPHKESKMTQLLRECLNSLTCQATVIAHASNAADHYSDSLATIQLASRIHRTRRKKIKMRIGGSGSSGTESSSTSGKSTGPSSSEQSCDTVIYLGHGAASGSADDTATDGEHPPTHCPLARIKHIEKQAQMKGARDRGPKPPLAPKPTRLPRPVTPKYSAISQPRANGIEGKDTTNDPLSTDADTAQLMESETAWKEEHWIDGPKFSKSQVARARRVKAQTAGIRTNGALLYGFMDRHKKAMIEQWVKGQAESAEVWIDQPPSEGDCQPITEQTQEEVSPERDYKVTAVDIENENEGYDLGTGQDPDLELILVRDTGAQVTEEDISRCLGVDIENPLPESDQESLLDHPLRILNGISVYESGDDLEDPSNLTEDLLQAWRCEYFAKRFPIPPLAQEEGNHNTPLRCQSLTLKDMLYGSAESSLNEKLSEIASISSEPFREDKVPLVRSKMRPLPEDVANSCLCSDFETQLQNKLSLMYASLRLPDGALDPNFTMEENVVKPLEPMTSEKPCTVSDSSLHSLSRSHTLSSSGGSGSNTLGSNSWEGYDSGHDSGLGFQPHNEKGKDKFLKLLGRAKPVHIKPPTVQDSESSSGGSSQDSDPEEDRNIKCLEAQSEDPECPPLEVEELGLEDVIKAERLASSTPVDEHYISCMRGKYQSLLKELGQARARLVTHEVIEDTDSSGKEPVTSAEWESEVQHLEKQVASCKAKLLMVTCFDSRI
ncbi:unnamed protein product [Darwinula stevensoni]|uniref:Kinesin motor domain-containing protein n=1 Tax=Darwinula stevensoni TaxID=69355 RepID=A0A7R9FPD7_9CRUS|nr:unnamed protein product [Darwinula stevensoni]CAG0897482.1 unnamed protein product [Darwinula stevensoni]